jgi:cellulose synthase/poly-beta-1,6-N-acetylglucosamine synthase-like glycosyltransferase
MPLTRQFTIEYAIWFYAILPGLAELGLPFTLGGTSNHFRTGALRRIGAWDAYNVTEDADVGMRLARFGFRSAVLESTTWEEANCRLGNWIRQRSRWQKGFLQTWLVHMREPRALLRALGWRGFCVFQILVGGSIVTGWAPALFLASLALSLAGVRLAPASAVYDALIVGNLLVTAASIFVAAAFASVALRATGQRHLLSSLPGMPLYWLLVSIGAAKGGWQFLVNRSYWEKTTHGLSHAGAPEGAQASLSEDSVWLPCASQAARSGQP